MKELLETLIKEKGLWKQEIDTLEEVRVRRSGQNKGLFVVLVKSTGKPLLGQHIWHIDTLREICKAKWGDGIIEVSGVLNEMVKDVSWYHHFNYLVNIDSPQEREQYLLSN